MKKIFLYAYDRQNLGDDLFVHAITKRYPDARFYMQTSLENKKTFSCLPNLKILDKESRFVKLLRVIRPSLVARYKEWLEKRCDAVVYIGGSIFIEYDNWQQILQWWEYEANNRPFYVLGANFGPYHTPAYRDKMAEIFNNMQDVCFRDRYSHALFINDTAARYAPDILLGYPMPQVAVTAKQVFVSVIDCAGRDESHDLSVHDERYVQNMASVLRAYREDGYTIVLASFCKHEGDENGVAKIIKTMGAENDPQVKTLYYTGQNADELTEAIVSSEYVIATRFHATILALAAGRPVLPVIYSDKTTNVLKDMGFNGVSYDLREMTEWDYIQSKKNLENGVSVPMEMIKKANEHFLRFDKIMEEDDEKR